MDKNLTLDETSGVTRKMNQTLKLFIEDLDEQDAAKELESEIEDDEEKDEEDDIESIGEDDKKSGEDEGDE